MTADVRRRGPGRRPPQPCVPCPTCERVKVRACLDGTAVCECSRCRAFRSRHGRAPTAAIIAGWVADDEAAELGGSDRVRSVETVAVAAWRLEAGDALEAEFRELDSAHDYWHGLGDVDDPGAAMAVRPVVRCAMRGCTEPVQRRGQTCRDCIASW